MSRQFSHGGVAVEVVKVKGAKAEVLKEGYHVVVFVSNLVPVEAVAA